MSIEIVKWLVMISLALYCIELSLFSIIKKTLSQIKRDPSALEAQLKQVFDHIEAKHLALYSAIYFALLLLAKWFSPMVLIVIGIQGFSVLFDCSILLKLRKK